MISFIVNLIAILITWAPVACGGLFHHHCNSSNSWGLDRASQSAAYKCFFGYPPPHIASVQVRLIGFLFTGMLIQEIVRF